MFVSTFHGNVDTLESNVYPHIGRDVIVAGL